MTSTSSGSSKRVTFSDEGDNARSNKTQPPKTQNSKENLENKRRIPYRSSLSKDDKPQKPVAPPSTSRSTSSTSTASRKPHSRKTLVRNCNIDNPSANARVERLGSQTEIDQDRGWGTISSSVFGHQQQTLAVPLLNTNIETARKIEALSQLDLDSARTISKEFDINEEELIRKVATLATNVPRHEQLYTDLVSVEASKATAKPKVKPSLNLRKKSDPVPVLQDFTCKDKAEDIKVWPEFRPATISFKTIDLCDSRRVINSRLYIQNQVKELLSNK